MRTARSDDSKAPAIQPVIQQALAQAGLDGVAGLDAIAVTYGPGLAGSLLVGVNAAKGLAFASGLPLLPINTLESSTQLSGIILGFIHITVFFAKVATSRVLRAPNCSGDSLAKGIPR